MVLTPGSSHGEAARTSGSVAVVSSTSRSPRRRSSSYDPGMSAQIANAAGPPSPDALPGPLPALGADEAEDGVAAAGGGDRPGGQVLQAAGEGQVDRLGRAGQAVQVGAETERAAGVDAQGLEHGVAPDQREVERVEGRAAPALDHARPGGQDGEDGHRGYLGSRSSR